MRNMWVNDNHATISPLQLKFLSNTFSSIIFSAIRATFRYKYSANFQHMVCKFYFRSMVVDWAGRSGLHPRLWGGLLRAEAAGPRRGNRSYRWQRSSGSVSHQLLQGKNVASGQILRRPGQTSYCKLLVLHGVWANFTVAWSNYFNGSI